MQKALVLALAALVSCSLRTSSNLQEGKHPDAKVWHDAPPPLTDANLGPSPGQVTCFYPNFPNNECPTNLTTEFCCFWPGAVPPSGGCSNPNTLPCAHSFEYCDGPEDCPTGQQCFGHSYFNGTEWSWTMQCSTTAPDPANDLIMCRVGGAACAVGSCTAPSTSGLMPTQYYCH